MFLSLTFVCLILPTLSHGRKSDQCQLSLDDTSFTSPLYLNSNGEELLPEGKESNIILEHKDRVTFACYSSGNKVLGYATKSVKGICLGQNNIKTRKGIFKFNSFSCWRPIYPMFVTKGNCNGPKRGKLFEIGYKGDGKDFVKSMTVCHIKEKGSTVWVYYTLEPQVYRHRARHIRMEEEFKIGPDYELYGPIASNLSELYKTVKESVIEPIIWPDETKENITVGMLAPFEDFISYNVQKSTFFYINAVPMWVSVNQGPWRAIESVIRKKYREDSDPLTVLVGTFGVKSLNERELWLTRDMIPFPKYLWKALIRNGKSIVFSVENTPVRRGVTLTPFSDSISCARKGWNFGRYSEKINCGSFKKLLTVLGGNNLPNNILQQLIKKS